jgi:HD superfamily phosphohydrolase
LQLSTGGAIKRIFDPIHHFIELDEAEVALLSTPPMQRLRRLRQLGLAYLAYPSAEHSRFSHALGALAMGDRILEALHRHSPEYFTSEADFKRQRRLLRASLLVHDIGHGPFSHACEAVLGVAHEQRTAHILAQPLVAQALERLGVSPNDILALVVGDPQERYPVLRELVSGPNLDADRMDYLLRDGYFTGVASGRYDVDQLVSSLRIFEIGGRPQLGIDGRGVVALESFVLARYMMFATVYFHHTTRMFERILQQVLRELWPQPRALDDVSEYLEWDDFRVLDATRTMPGESARALRERITLYGLAAEFNAERDLRAYDACERALRERYGDAVWGDSQEQLLHRLPLAVDESTPTVVVRTSGGIVDAREASDVIAKLSGKAYWRKLFVRKSDVQTSEARALCREIIGGEVVKGAGK